MPSGYSGTPLAKKLSLKDGYHICFLDMPETGIKLIEALNRFRHTINQDGQIWVSWPKKASKVVTDVTEDTIREVCLPMGLVLIESPI